MESNNLRAITTTEPLDFCDATGKTLKDALVKDLVDAKYYSLLTDGSTDFGVVEQVRFHGIKGPDHANAVGLEDAV